MPALREVSRQEYLRAREEKELEALRDELEDAKFLFQGVKLTAGEEADLAYKQRVYDLAVARKAELDKVAAAGEGYRLPGSYGESRGFFCCCCFVCCVCVLVVAPALTTPAFKQQLN